MLLPSLTLLTPTRFSYAAYDLMGRITENIHRLTCQTLDADCLQHQQAVVRCSCHKRSGDLECWMTRISSRPWYHRLLVSQLSLQRTVYRTTIVWAEPPECVCLYRAAPQEGCELVRPPAQCLFAQLVLGRLRELWSDSVCTVSYSEITDHRSARGLGGCALVQQSGIPGQ